MRIRLTQGPLGQQGRVNNGALYNAILALDPIAYWPLWESSGTTAEDVTGNGHDGTYTGTYTLGGASGDDGRSYVDLAGGYVTVPDDDDFSIDTHGGMTWFCLVIPDDVDTTGREFLISKGDGSGNYEWEFDINTFAGGDLRLAVYRNLGGTALTDERSNNAVDELVWNSVAARVGSPVEDADTDLYSGSPIELAIDGSSSGIGTYGNGTSQVVIGHRGDFPSGQNLAGGIAHVAVFAGEIDTTSLFVAAFADGWPASPVYVPTELTIPTYEASGEATHPSVVQFDTAWNGYRYWMAMTPYPASDETKENPSILASNDMVTWVVPGSLTNPITATPGGTDYNADTDLVYDEDNDQLVCYYSQTSGSVTTKTHYAKTSSDGETWSSASTLFSQTIASENDASESVIKTGASEWTMWTVEIVASPNIIQKRTATTATGTFGSKTTCTVSGLPLSGRDNWHIGVFEDTGGTYRMFICDSTLDTSGGFDNEVFLASSSNGTAWTADPNPVMVPQAGTWTASRMYRTVGVLSGTNVDVFTSADDGGPDWGIGYVQIPLDRWPDP